MYRSDRFLVPGVRVGRYHRLAEAIRRGCKLRPRQAYGRFRNRKGDSACALGAAALGAGDTRPRYTLNSMWRLFPELKDMIEHPWRSWPEPLLDVVMMFNDRIGYSRETIADWLCCRGGCTHEGIDFSRVD
jgi:hypothetical protein